MTDNSPSLQALRPASLLARLLLWLLCWHGQAAWGFAPQEFTFADPYFEAIESVKSPSPVITALAQDAQGWLWIGTGDGLFRYDGYRLRKFAHESARADSLGGNFVTAIWPAQDGRLWVGTQSDGLSIFDPQTEKFTHLQHKPAQAQSLSAGRIWALQGDASGGVWIGTNEGLDYVAPGGTALRHFRHQPGQAQSLMDNRIRSLLLDKQGTLFIGTVSGLQRYQPGSKPSSQASSQPVFVRVASDPAQAGSLAGQNIQTLFQASDGKLWIGTHKQGAAWLAPQAIGSASANPNWLPPDPQRADRLSHGWVDAIIEAEAGEIWLATAGGGINIVSGQDGKLLRQIRHDPALAGSLQHDSVKQILRDQSGLLWIATWGGGLQRYHPAQGAFRVVRHRPAHARGLSHADVRSVLELADGRILVGTGGNGIDIFDRKQGLTGGWRAKPGQRGGLPDGNIMALLEQADGTLWAGTQQAGVVRLARGSEHWQAFGVAEGLPAPLVRTLFQSRAGTLWVAGTNGMARWEPGTARFVAARQRDGSVLQADVLALAEDRQGNLWAASDQGLWRQRAGSADWENFVHQAAQPNSLSGNNLQSLLIDATGVLWISGTKGLDRLSGFVAGAPVFEHVGSKLARSNDEIGSDLWQDRQGRIWIGAAEQALDPLTLKTSRNGLPDLGASWIGAWGSSHDGLLLYGGVQGLAIFDPSRYQPWTFQAPVRVSELKIDGHAVPAALRQGLSLQPEQRNFSVEFSALDFFKPGAIRYRYRLQGYDRDWIDSDPEHRVAAYGNLWPGKYVLQIQSTNSVGDWNPQPLAIPVQVLPALWQNWWFMLLAGLSILAAIRALHQLRVARLKAQHHEQAEQLRAMVEQRTSEIVCAHNALAAAHTELSQSHQSLQQTQQQLILQEKMAGLGTLTAGIAHEINNPLNFTHVAAQIQRDKVNEFEQFVQSLFDADTDPRVVAGFSHRFAELHQNLDIMQDGTDRINAVVRDLRAFTRLDEAERKTVQLSQSLSATVNLVRTQWQDQVDFVTEWLDDPPYECWPALLNQVFMNLVLNACQAIAAKQQQQGSNARGRVNIKLQQQAQHLCVTIEDDGIGMSEQLQKRIMEPFFTTREVGSGAGMGLAVSYGIIQKHGGTLEISTAVGSGSRFTIRLPLQ